jgi:hypothetical protein
LWLNKGQLFRVSGLPPLIDAPAQEARGWLAEARLDRLDRAVLSYTLAFGKRPGTLAELVEAGLIDRSQTVDPWARPYHYALTRRGYLLTALDAEGKGIPGLGVERVLAEDLAR